MRCLDLVTAPHVYVDAHLLLSQYCHYLAHPVDLVRPLLLNHIHHVNYRHDVVSCPESRTLLGLRVLCGIGRYSRLLSFYYDYN